MSIRVCANGHLTGQRHCYCGADAVRPLRDRVKPIPRHELASVQPVKQKVVEIPKSPFRLWRHKHWVKVLENTGIKRALQWWTPLS